MAATRKSTTSSPSTRSAAKGRSTKASGAGRSPARSAARSGGSQTTVDHEQIRQWAESRGGKPACVRGTGGKADTGMIRLDFPGYSGKDSLQEITWNEFFEAFDGNNLALVYQEKTKDGKPSRFNKLVSRPRSQSATPKGESKRRQKEKMKT